MTRNCLGSTHQGRSGTARVVRLAAVACLALAAGSAAVWAQTAGNLAADHRCIHDEVQQRVLQSVAQEHGNLGTLSAVGLPVVAAEPAPTAQHGGVDYALADSTSSQVERSDDWEQLRITASVEDLTEHEFYCASEGQNIYNHLDGNVTCTAADVVTKEKRDMLVNYILPQALKLHTDRLKVKRQQGTWRVGGMTGQACEAFMIPKWHRTTGFNNTDFLLYVASAPCREGVRAWATICQTFSDGRPAVGVINIAPAKIVSRYDQRTTRTVAHEIAHALGFTGSLFNDRGITQNVSGIRDKELNITVINGTRTVTKAREHYGCDNLSYVELEDPGSPGSSVSHLKMRNANDELMAPSSSAGYYSAVTMAIFEDTGFYKADFSKAEVMRWGRNAGCDFFSKKCMENNITQWPQMFCNDTNEEYLCTSSRLHIGGCDVLTYAESLPSHWQYFANDRLGGSIGFLDICPVVVPSDEGACNQNTTTAPWYVRTFNVFSEAARCIDGSFTPKGLAHLRRLYNGMCANIQCDTSTQTYGIQVRWGSGYFNCTPGQNISLATISSGFEDGGYITCPPYAEVCQGNVKAVVDFKAALEKNRGTSSSSSGRGHTPTDSMPSSGQGHTPTDSMPSSGSGANKPDATSSNGIANRLFPLGNGAAGLDSARTLVSAGVGLLVVTLTVVLSA